MSEITSITYPNKYGAYNEDGEITRGALIYEPSQASTSDRYIDVTNCDKKKIILYENPRISSFTKPLILELQTFSNGLRYIMEYYTEDRGIDSGYLIDAKLKIVDENDNVIGNIYDEHGSVICYGESTLQFGVNHFIGSSLSDVEGVYIPSITEYYSTSTTITSGTGAGYIRPFGALVFERSILQDISDINGKVKLSDFNSFNLNYPPNAYIDTQEELDAFTEGIKDAGDGKDPYDDDNTKPPYERDTSGTGGGNGGYNKGGNDIYKPNLPVGQAIHTGFVNMYNPSLENLRSLASKLWTDEFIESILQLWNDPMEGIISLSLFPVAPDVSSAQNCVIGNYDTEVSMPVVSSQYKSVNCGNLSLDEYWGSALDYEPYTKVSIFLPFIGIVPLHTDDVMGKIISVFYNIDFLTGSANCSIMADLSVLYEFPCNISSNIPIASSNYADLYSNLINSIKNVSIGAVAGNVGGAVAGGLTSATNVVTSKQSQVERGSNITSTCGILGHFKPFLIVHRPKQSLPSNFGHYKGFPSNITRVLSGVHGYTEVEYVHLDGLNGATDIEKDEIDRLLKSGVIL